MPARRLAFLNQIEAELKRERVVRWGPRTIDLDILFYDDLVYNSESGEDELINPDDFYKMFICEKLLFLKYELLILIFTSCIV